MAGSHNILRGQNIPELIVIVDDGVDLLATRRHSRGEGSVNGESETGISTPAPDRNRGCRKEKETKTPLRSQDKLKNWKEEKKEQEKGKRGDGCGGEGGRRRRRKEGN